MAKSKAGAAGKQTKEVPTKMDAPIFRQALFNAWSCSERFGVFWGHSGMFSARGALVDMIYIRIYRPPTNS